MQDPSELRNADGSRAVPRFEDRQRMRQAIHEAQHPNDYNVIHSSDDVGFDPRRQNVAELLLRQYTQPPKPGTPERRTYDRLIAQRDQWLADRAEEDAVKREEDLWRSTPEYKEALAAYNDAKAYIADPAKAARLDTLLHDGGPQFLSTFYQELGAIVAEQRMLKAEAATNFERQMSQIKQDFALASRDAARLDSVLSRARHALGQPEPTPQPTETATEVGEGGSGAE